MAEPPRTVEYRIEDNNDYGERKNNIGSAPDIDFYQEPQQGNLYEQNKIQLVEDVSFSDENYV